jgi:hypothetical protein
MIKAQIGEAALHRLQINYAMHELPDGTLFFCRLPDGTMFNLLLSSQETVRLWKFLCADMPEDAIGTQLFYCSPASPHGRVGFEVTEECDLRCFVEQTLCMEEHQIEEQVMLLVAAFCNLVSRLSPPQ